MGTGMWLPAPNAREFFTIQKKNQSHKKNSFLIIEVSGQASRLPHFFIAGLTLHLFCGYYTQRHKGE